jgi:hypothetical protein
VATPARGGSSGGIPEVKGEFYHAIANLRVRSDKLKNAPAIATIAKGFIINVASRDGDWFRLYLNESGQVGWILARNKDRELVEPYPNGPAGYRVWREQIADESRNPTLLSPSNFSPQQATPNAAERGRSLSGPPGPREESLSPPRQQSPLRFSLAALGFVVAMLTDTCGVSDKSPLRELQRRLRRLLRSRANTTARTSSAACGLRQTHGATFCSTS